MTKTAHFASPINGYLPNGVEIEVRRMDMQIPQNLPRHWYNNNSLVTSLLIALSAVFPDGERFFIDTVRHYEDQIDDPELKKLIKAFIGQEAHHGNEHETFNALLEEKHGHPMKKIAGFVKTGLAYARDIFSAERQLSMTIALEHLTAVFAHQALSNNDILMEGVDESVRDLFTWHAIEETEHKALAYDVYQRVSGDYWLRIFTMARVTFFFTLNVSIYQMMILYKQGQFPLPKEIWGYIDFLWGRKGFLRKSARHYFAYYRRTFHPWEQDNSKLIKDWKDKYQRLSQKQKNAA